MSPKLSTKWLLAFLSILLFPAVQCVAQTADIPSGSGTEDQGIKFPRRPLDEGKKDPAGLSVIRSFVALSGNHNSRAFCLSGTIRLGGDTSEEKVNLAFSDSDKSRMDIEEPSGVKSLRITGEVGGLMQSDGLIQYFPLSLARAGLMVTPFILESVSLVPEASIVDEGSVMAGGRSYRSITYSLPMLSMPTSRLIPPLVRQLFFEPESGRLAKSVESVVLSDTSRSRHLRVISYDNYQTVDSGVFPLSISELQDGQPVWALSVATVNHDCTKSPSYFVFSVGAK